MSNEYTLKLNSVNLGDKRKRNLITQKENELEEEGILKKAKLMIS